MAESWLFETVRNTPFLKLDQKIPPPPTPWEIPTGPHRTEPASRRGTCLYHIGYGKRKEGQEINMAKAISVFGNRYGLWG